MDGEGEGLLDDTAPSTLLSLPGVVLGEAILPS